MEATAKIKMVRHSSRKLRLVADEIRGMKVDTAFNALAILKSQKKAAAEVENALKSAVANFQNKNENGNSDELSVKAITIDNGPQIKRIRARAQGRAFRIIKKLSHITIVVGD